MSNIVFTVELSIDGSNEVLGYYETQAEAEAAKAAQAKKDLALFLKSHPIPSNYPDRWGGEKGWHEYRDKEAAGSRYRVESHQVGGDLKVLWDWEGRRCPICNWTGRVNKLY